MANGHGGKRPGSGRPRKPLAEKILEGNPGKRKAKVLDIPACADIPIPEPPEYLRTMVASGVSNNVPQMKDVFNETVEWLKNTGCLHLINPQLITEYSIHVTRWLECEDIVSKSLYLMHKDKDTDKKSGKINLEPNPLSDQALRYWKAADTAWKKIWEIVQQNSVQLISPTPDVMMELLNFGRED